jgi:hypothetical protein
MSADAMKTILFAGSLIIALAVSGPAAASNAMESFRNSMKKATSEKVAKIQTYSNAQQLNKEFDTRCGAVAREIDRAYASSFCPTGCPNTTASYDAALAKVNEKARDQNGSKHHTWLNACLSFAIASEDDKRSYGMSVMLREGQKTDHADWMGFWAASSLALGKGVPQNRSDALKVLRSVARPDLPQHTKNMLLSLANWFLGL